MTTEERVDHFCRRHDLEWLEDEITAFVLLERDRCRRLVESQFGVVREFRDELLKRIASGEGTEEGE